jgi:hypothetical protein
MKLSSLYTSSNLPYVRLSDTKPSGTAGTTYTSGAYRTITINTEEQDVEGVCSLSSNQFTLSAGKYAVRIFTTGEVQRFFVITRIRNVTDSATVLKWPAYAQSFGTAEGFGLPPAQEGQFVIGSGKALELQIYPQSNYTQAAKSDGESEVYWTLELVKLD